MATYYSVFINLIFHKGNAVKVAQFKGVCDTILKRTNM